MALLAAALFIGSIGLLLLRPRGVPDWAAALGGGALMVALGVLPVGDAIVELGSAWNVFLFFLGLGISAATADQAGVFELAAALAARWAGGSQRRLLIGLYLVGIVVTAILSNDATALLLTPVVFAIASRTGVDPRPYAFACATPMPRRFCCPSPIPPTCCCSRKRRSICAPFSDSCYCRPSWRYSQRCSACSGCSEVN